MDRGEIVSQFSTGSLCSYEYARSMNYFQLWIPITVRKGCRGVTYFLKFSGNVFDKYSTVPVSYYRGFIR